MAEIRRFMGFSEIALHRYDGVLIDLDDTLYIYEPCHRHALEAAFSACDMRLVFTDFARVYRKARDTVTKRLAGQGACRSRLFAFQAMAEARGLSKPYSTALALDRAYWDAFLSRMKPAPEALAFLQDAKRVSMRVAVVTDMTAEVQIGKLERLGLVNLIDHLVTSEVTGHEKPHRAMFETALAKLGVGAGRAVMIGDHVDKDILGAAALGIDGALIELKDRDA